MANEQLCTTAVAFPRPPPLSGNGPCSLHDRIARLQADLCQVMRVARQDQHQINQLQLERDRLQVIVNGFEDTDARYRQSLSRECTAHSLTRDELQSEKTCRVEMAQANMQLQHELLQTHAARVVAERAFAWEKDLHRDTAIELDRTRRKIELVDKLLDTLLLNTSSQFELHTRRVTDVALDLESQTEGRYRVLLEEKDERITKLERALLHRRRERKPRPCRAQSAPPY
ncbi:hypothetical protein PABG_02471 [Paracoccidioides brasiliensis Pb03]|nr:hypothetical protein PABG_02471 [Paracoccidioides brasiliensis Pb03]